MPQSEKYDRMLFEKSVIGLALCRMNGDLVDVNPAYTAILGRTIEETLHLSYWEITPKKYETQELAQLESLEKTGKYGPYEKEYIHADGRLIPVRLSGQIVEKDGEKFIWSSVEDITELKQAESALRESEGRLSNFFKATFECIFFHDGGIILDINPATSIVFGYSHDEIIGQHLLDYVDLDSQNHVKRNMSIRHDGPYEATILTKDKKKIPVEVRARTIRSNGKDIRVVGLRDISRQKKAEEKLEYIAHHDILTGLPNRLRFKIDIEQAIKSAKRYRHKLALMFIDLNKFKSINDTLGHDAGDQYLKLISERLKSCVRKIDTVARVGGDEFTILLTDIERTEDAEIIARKVINAINQPITINENELSPSISIGISIYPDDSTILNELLRASDAAMYRSKGMGENIYQFFNP